MTSERLPRRVRNKRDKRARIQAAALKLFAERGFDATTTKAVADEAGVAAGTLFLYAEDKRELLFLALHDELRRIVDAQLASLPDGPLLGRLLHLFRGLLAFYALHPKVAHAFLQALFTSHRGPNALSVDRLTVETIERIAALVAEAAARGEVAADVPPLLAAQNCFALYTTSLIAWLRGYVPTVEEAADPLLRMALELQMRGLLPRR